ncbi:MAG: alpha-glucosidase C-terminal domain-containing protein, partial [Pseudoxanthomonas sp.]
GEELGLGEADVPYEALQDPYGKTFWPNFKGRDGCRTPMPWDASAQAGFTTGTPWLPIADTHRALAVAGQEGDADSTLNATRRFLRWRKSVPALQWGDIRFLDVPEPVLAFTRESNGQRLLVAFNLSAEAVECVVPAATRAQALDGHGLRAGQLHDGLLRLPGQGVLYAELS